jgi:hypothetical protein
MIRKEHRNRSVKSESREFNLVPFPAQMTVTALYPAPFGQLKLLALSSSPCKDVQARRSCATELSALLHLQPVALRQNDHGHGHWSLVALVATCRRLATGLCSACGTLVVTSVVTTSLYSKSNSKGSMGAGLSPDPGESLSDVTDRASSGVWL